MAGSEITIEEIHKYLIQCGGFVSNRDVVRHFKRYLTDPISKGNINSSIERKINYNYS